MRINGHFPYAWDQINEKARGVLKTNSAVQVFKSTPHGLFDILLGLHLKFSHKRKIVAKLGHGSHMHNLQIELAKLGVRFKPQFEEAPEVGIDKDVKASLAFVYDGDDALTSQIYDHSATLGSLEGKSIFRVGIFHHSFYTNADLLKSIGPYDIFVFSLTRSLSIAVMGEKCLLPAFSANTLVWSEAEEADLQSALHKKVKEDAPTVSAFEAALESDAKPWFAKGFSQRVFDRAVITFPNFDGEAVVEMHQELHGGDRKDPGQACAMESASYSRWQNKIWLDQAESLGRTPEAIRGLVSIAASEIDGQFAEKLKKTISELKMLSQ